MPSVHKEMGQLQLEHIYWRESKMVVTLEISSTVSNKVTYLHPLLPHNPTSRYMSKKKIVHMFLYKTLVLECSHQLPS